MSGPLRPWHTIEPADAVDITLPMDGIKGPSNEMGEPCPWPWEPIQLKGLPIGQYHCPYCGAMVIAGMHHIDYSWDGIVPDDQGHFDPDDPFSEPVGASLTEDED